MKWLLLLGFFYLLYKAFIPLLALFRFNQSIKKNKHQNKIHRKLSKMDIQDAEFDDINT